MMRAQAPLAVAQRKRCRAKDTKARRSPIEEPAWAARKLTKETAPTPRRPPSSLTRAWKAKPLGRRLPHPLGVLLGLGEEGRVARRGRRARTDASERGHGRAHVSYGVVEAVLVAERQIRSVVGKEHHLLGLKGPVQTRHGGQHGVHVLDVVVPARAELGAAWAAQGVVAKKVNSWGRCFSILLIRVRAARRARQVVARSLYGLL